MRTLRTLLAVAALLLVVPWLGSTADAGKKKPAPKEEKPREDDKPRKDDKPKKDESELSLAEGALPAAGTCGYVQPGVKLCSLLQGSGSFDVITYPPASVLITFEEEVTIGVQPPEQYFETKVVGNVVTVVPLTSKLPSRAPLTVKTASDATVTINLIPGSLKKVDTQVSVKDPERRSRAEVRLKRREEEVAAREKEVGAREATLERVAAERAEEQLLRDLAVSGAELVGTGAKAAQNDDLIVIRPKQVLSVGQRRYVLFTVENLSGTDFEVKDVKLWLKTGDTERAGKARWTFAATTISPDKEIRGVVALPPPASGKASSKRQVRIRVEEKSGKRSIEASGIQVP